MRPIFMLTCVLILSLSGCAGSTDPFERPGNYEATNAPNEDIAQQVANKGDLIQGHGEEDSNGVAASSALDRALTGGTATGLHTPAAITITPNGN